MVAAGLVVGGGAVLAAPLVLSAAGFTAGGVAAGSAAAFAQSIIGNVAAGSWFALCQSAGAAGISAASSAIIGTVGGAVGSTAVAAAGLSGKKEEEPDSSESKKKDNSDDGSSSTLQQVGVVCAYSVCLTLLCIVAAIFINSWIGSSSRPALPPTLRRSLGGGGLPSAEKVRGIIRKVSTSALPKIESHIKSFSGSTAAKSNASAFRLSPVTLIIFVTFLAGLAGNFL